MKIKSRAATPVSLRLTGIFILVMVEVSAPLSPSQNTSGKTAGRVYKNVQVFKGVPSEQLIPAMQFMVASLGVECDFCHVEGAFENDDKKPKQTARKMVLMTFAINRDNFDGRRKVTCYSCHRGSDKPLDTPIITGQEPELHAAGTASQREAVAFLPAAEQILEHYVQAVGGKRAIQGISSRIEEGKAEIGSLEFPVEIFYESPDKLTSVIDLPNGDNISVYDGHAGWIAFPGRAVREMEQFELDGARVDADLRRPLELRHILRELRVEGEDKVGEHETYVATAFQEGGPPARLYFDKESGLLVRLVRYMESPLGQNPVQTDYFDYRQSGAVKVPFRWTVARPGGRFTVQLERVRQNVPIDRSRFAKPFAQEASEKP